MILYISFFFVRFSSVFQCAPEAEVRAATLSLAALSLEGDGADATNQTSSHAESAAEDACRTIDDTRGRSKDEPPMIPR